MKIRLINVNDLPLFMQVKKEIMNAPTISPPQVGFTVIDKTTGQYPDLWEIAQNEEWAHELEYYDMEGFCINEDGLLILCDECGNFAYCPDGRFEVIFGGDDDAVR